MSDTPKNTGKFGKGNPGKPKGAVNKVTMDLRQMVLAALDKAGGAAYLQQQAKDNPAAFMTMLGKCLPKDVKIEGDISLSVTVQRLTEGAK